MQSLPQYLTHQALSPKLKLSKQVPSILRIRTAESPEIWEIELSDSRVIDSLQFSNFQRYVDAKRIHSRYKADYHLLTPLLSEASKAEAKPYYASEITAEGIAANKARFAAELQNRQEAVAYRRMMQQSITDSRKYNIKALSQSTIVSCPVTGICFSVEMPSIPIFVQSTHPYADTNNVLKTLEWFFVTSAIPGRLQELDTPVLAGMLIVLLRMKHILVEQETSALAQNALLQHIPKGTLCHYIQLLYRGREQHKVWQNMPKLRLNAEGQSVLATLEAWFAKASLHLHGKPSDDADSTQAKLFEATRFKSLAQKTLKVYSAEKTQHRLLKDNKQQAQELFKQLADQMPPTLRGFVRTTISNLLLITHSDKESITAALGRVFLGTKQEATAKQLAALLQGTETNHIAKELGRASDDFANMPKRSISEILKSKLNKE